MEGYSQYLNLIIFIINLLLFLLIFILINSRDDKQKKDVCMGSRVA